MESEEGPAAAAAASSSPPPPPHPDASPVGSPDHALDDVHALLSDDDHDHDLGHGDDGVQEEEPAAGAGGGLTEDLKRKIIKQVEYYFSDENLRTDNHMNSWIRKNKEGFVPVGVIASFRKMKKLIRDNALVAAALKESNFVVVSSDEKKVKRLHPFPLAAVRDPKLYTVLVENLPEDHSVENLRRIFGEAGNIKHICVRDPHATEESSKSDRAEKFLSSKLHALVEYETVEAAEKAVASLNNEQDWRSGMHVKLLKRMARHGQKKQTWRGPEPEKNHAGRLPDRTGDEGNHNSSEHHDDTPDEEAGPHLHKEKNEHRDRGRNRGRSGRQKHRGPNGHGTTWSGHSHEPPKPPPGPKMPDGTRGFTMGRGRPPISNQS
ncbi:la-related protein 6A [Morus notabilis]|uniref:la-related protein 6A n=1 Tax=Morus notabilis TaxID=981085 RepID=UPI000CED24F1|nr:la-related protein 6A [Morus notabilis]